MGVVELDRDLVGERAPVGIAPAEAPHEVRERAGDEEILLHEAQSLPHARGVVGIEDPRQGFGREPLGQRAHELAGAERLEVEDIGRGGGPEPERVDGLAAVAHHRAIERQAEQARWPAGDHAQAAAAHLERAAELDLHLLLRPGDLPRVGPPQPVVRLLALPAILDRLPEDAVLVAQPVAHGRELHRGHRVEEARREAAEPAVAEAGVRLLLEQGEPVEALVVGDPLRDRIEEEVHDVVGERAPDQELHGEIVDALGVLALVRLLGAQPPLREDVPHGAGDGLVALARTHRRGIDDVVEHEMPLVERIARPRELDRAAPVLLEKLLLSLACPVSERVPRLSCCSYRHPPRVTGVASVQITGPARFAIWLAQRAAGRRERCAGQSSSGPFQILTAGMSW